MPQIYLKNHEPAFLKHLVSSWVLFLKLGYSKIRAIFFFSFFIVAMILVIHLCSFCLFVCTPQRSTYIWNFNNHFPFSSRFYWEQPALPPGV